MNFCKNEEIYLGRFVCYDVDSQGPALWRKVQCEGTLWTVMRGYQQPAAVVQPRSTYSGQIKCTAPCHGNSRENPQYGSSTNRPFLHRNFIVHRQQWNQNNVVRSVEWKVRIDLCIRGDKSQVRGWLEQETRYRFTPVKVWYLPHYHAPLSVLICEEALALTEARRSVLTNS